MPETVYLMLVVFVIGLFFCLWMLVDCIYYEAKEWDKTIWLCVIVLLNVFGAALYLILRYRTNRQSAPPPEIGKKPGPDGA